MKQPKRKKEAHTTSKRYYICNQIIKQPTKNYKYEQVLIFITVRQSILTKSSCIMLILFKNGACRHGEKCSKTFETNFFKNYTTRQPYQNPTLNDDDYGHANDIGSETSQIINNVSVIKNSDTVRYCIANR